MKGIHRHLQHVVLRTPTIALHEIAPSSARIPLWLRGVARRHRYRVLVGWFLVRLIMHELHVPEPLLELDVQKTPLSRDFLAGCSLGRVEDYRGVGAEESLPEAHSAIR